MLGHSVQVVTALPSYPTDSIFPDYRGKWLMRECWDGIPVIRGWAYPAKGKGVRRLFNYISFMPFALLGIMRAARPDYIFVETPPFFTFLPVWLTARRWGVKTIVNVADPWVDAARELGILSSDALFKAAESLERWIYARADWVSTVTKGMVQLLIERKGVPPEKVLFLPNGIDTEIFRPLPPENSPDLPCKPLMVYTGILGYAQGLDILLKCAHRLQKETVNFLLVGDGAERESLVAQARSMGCANVFFLPPKPPDKIPLLYAAADAGLVTLRNLPLAQGARPSKTLAIMACGKPVIYSGAGEGAEIVRQARAGLVIPPEDPEALAEAIRYILRHPDHAREMGENGRRFVEQHFSWRRLVQDWLSQLEDKAHTPGGAS
ncbi:Alpha-maltose-1-phosphate synthase [bacterium HR14]|jgi:glycosyltransferase involved in cell wall biosynthesis|nr:Alpha-maltose-1-phosphate synthase [bacterium HR14]